MINDYKPKYVVEQVLEAVKDIENPVIACLGLAYKANIDDLRESPAMEVVEKLSKAQAGTLLLSEPNINEIPASLRNSDSVFFENDLGTFHLSWREERPEGFVGKFWSF